MKNVVEVYEEGGVRYEKRLITCGRENCTKCPHGPYWYALVLIKGNKRITRYVGKTLKRNS